MFELPLVADFIDSDNNLFPDVLRINPQENILIGIDQGTGMGRDGATGRSGEIFDSTNSTFYSFSSNSLSSLIDYAKMLK